MKYADRVRSLVNLRQVVDIRGFAREQQDRLKGSVEQVLASAISMTGLIVLSRVMSISDFGILATATGIWLMMEMFQQSLVMGPFIVSCPHPDTDREQLGAWFIWNFLLAVIAAAGCAIFGFYLAEISPQLSQGLVSAAPITFAGMLYMFARRLHYHRRNHFGLLSQTFLYGLCYFAVLALVATNITTLTPAWGAAIITLAYGVPGAIFSLGIALRAQFQFDFLRHIKRARFLIMQLGAANAAWEFSYTGSLVALSVLSTPENVAIYSITRTLVRPISLLVSTLIDVDFSRCSRAYSTGGKKGLSAVIGEIWKAAVLASTVPILMLLAFPGFFLFLVYGEQYAGATLELQLRVLLFLPLLYVAPLELGLIVLRDTRFLISAHLASLAVGFVSLLAFYLFYQLDAGTALISLLLARIVSVPILHVRYFKQIAEPQAGPHSVVSSRAAQDPV